MVVWQEIIEKENGWSPYIFLLEMWMGNVQCFFQGQTSLNYLAVIEIKIIVPLSLKWMAERFVETYKDGYVAFKVINQFMNLHSCFHQNGMQNMLKQKHLIF